MSEGAGPIPPHTAAGAFVGRAQELARLEEAWMRATDRIGGLVLIAADPGMGKSQLVEQFAERRRSDKGAVFVGQCWEAGGAPAYWPWTQALRALVRDVGLDRLRERLGDRVALLRPVLPELAGDAETTATADDPDQARFQIFDAVGELLTEATFDAPLAILLEDLHAADEASLLLLEFLARASPALIVGTYREREAARRRPESALARVARRATVIALAPWTETEIAQYLEHAWGRTPPAHIVAHFLKTTEGNPLFVSELERRWRVETAPLDTLDVPPGVEATIRDHLAELDTTTLDVLGAASVLGRDFELGMLARLLGLDEAEAIARIEDAVKVDLLRTTRPGTYRFAHFMHRAMIYQGIPPARRFELHLRVTELLREDAKPEAMPWSSLAHHYLEAGPKAREEAVEAALQAGHAAARQRAFSDAAAFYTAASEVLEAIAPPTDARRCEALLCLARAQLDSGATEAGRRTCVVVARLARDTGDAKLLARAALAYGSVLVLGVVDPKLLTLLEDALSALGSTEPGLRAQVQARLAAALQPAMDPQGPIQLARDAIALARQTGDEHTLLTTIRAAGSAMMDLGDPVERAILNQEHVDLAMKLGERSEAMRGHLRLIMDALELGDLPRADHNVDALGRLADELALPHYQWLVYGIRSVRAQMEGRTKAAVRWTEQMRACGRRIDDPNFETTLQLHELGAMRMRGEHEAILERLDARGVAAVSDEWGPLFEHVLRASTLVRLGRTGELGPTLSPSQVRSVLSIGDPMMVVCIGEAAAAVGDTDLASRVHAVLQPRRGRCVSWGVLGLSWDGPIDRALGLLEAALGREDEARRSFDAAAQLCRRLETPLHLKVVEEDRSRALKQAPAEPEAESVPRPVELIELRREGEMWTVPGHTPALHFKDTKGMGMLARLLAEPGREFHVLDLSGALGADTGDAGPLLDERARTEYRRRADDLRSELAEAEEFNDTARAERAREELEALTRELGRAVGLGGRPRASKSAVERSRVNVQRRIKDAIVRIRERDEAIGRHLVRSVRTGTYCAYEPD